MLEVVVPVGSVLFALSSLPEDYLSILFPLRDFENASALYIYSEFASAIFEHVFDFIQLSCKLNLLFSTSTVCDDVICCGSFEG